MKKLILALSVLLAIACNTEKKEEANGKTASTKDAQPTDPTERRTLNGLSFDEADKMIKAFLADRKSSDTTTSIRFDQAFLDNVLLFIKQGKIDGVRFYFAKNNGKNTLIPVGTQKVAGTSRTGRNINKDFFDLKFPETTVMSSLTNEDELEPPKGSNIYSTLGVCFHATCPATESSIPCKTVRKWARAFKASAEDKDDIINVTSVWYGKEFFERLGAKIAAAKASGKDAGGIRIYFVRNNQGKNGLVFYTTYNKDGDKNLDDHFCYELEQKYNITYKYTERLADDRGEECPIFCPGTTWSDCE